MSVTWTQQYRPLLSVETREADGLSVRFLRDGARNVNVLCGSAVDRHVCDFVTVPSAGLSAAAETYLAQAWVPAHLEFSTFQAALWARTQAAGTATIRIYSDQIPYAGPEAFDAATYLSAARQSVAITVSGTANAWYEGGDLTIVRGVADRSHLIVTYQDGTSNVLFGHLAVWAKALT